LDVETWPHRFAKRLAAQAIGFKRHEPTERRTGPSTGLKGMKSAQKPNACARFDLGKNRDEIVLPDR
jgi:hypothetical protein